MKLATLRTHFLDELHGLYPSEEIKSFFYLLSEAHLNLSSVETVVFASKEISESVQEKYEDAISRLKHFEPIQYIIGESDFFGLTLKVTSHTLIPRPETEELVQLVLDEVAKRDEKNLQILDIGTGSGCIAIALAKHLPEAKVSAMEVSEEALKTAKENAKLNEVDINFILEDILQMKSLPDVYDIIVSNPPYVRLSEKELMQSNVLDFEPDLALFVDDQDPLLFYRIIAKLAKSHLTPKGKLFFEINEYLGEEMVMLLKNEGYQDVQLVQDVYGKNRMLKGTLESV